MKPIRQIARTVIVIWTEKDGYWLKPFTGVLRPARFYLSAGDDRMGERSRRITRQERGFICFDSQFRPGNHSGFND
jgi:hypothetical protein